MVQGRLAKENFWPLTVWFAAIWAVGACNQISGVSDYHKSGNLPTDSDTDDTSEDSQTGSESGQNTEQSTDSQRDTTIATDAQCNPGCIWEMRNDGNCDPPCMNLSCGFDDGDCDNKYCVDGCRIGDIHDNVCNEPCDVDICDFDGGDCDGMVKGCTPGCESSMVGDGVCQYQCLGAECGNDGGDCDDEVECAPACGNTMLANGECDDACNNPSCFMDNGDCAGGFGCDIGATSCLEQCVPCALESSCVPARDKCQSNPECLALQACFETDCAQSKTDLGTSECAAGCIVAHPEGVTDVNMLRKCLYCDACPVSCDPDFSAFCIDMRN